MTIQCAATLTMELDLPEKPFMRFRCEREVHEGNEHHTTGIMGTGQAWKMSWTEPIKGGKHESKFIF